MEIEFSKLTGKIIKTIHGAEPGSDEILISCEDGAIFRLYHRQDCGESVYVEDIDGTPVDLHGAFVSLAEEVSQQNKLNYGTETWTFYKIQTPKGDLTIRWYGSSNGYYSESVDVELLHNWQE